MADYGMTPEGFIPKRLAQIQEDMNQRFALIQDPATGEFPFQNITDDTILQQIVGVFAEKMEEGWNAAYEGSIQFDPLKNTGSGQSGTVQLNAMLRKPGTYTRVQMILTGQANTIVPAGNCIASEDRLRFVTTQDTVMINANGTVYVNAIASQKEPWNPALNSIVAIQTPVSGWSGARNVQTYAVGSYEENDEQLRMRQQQSTSLTAYRLIDAIYAAVRNVPGVMFVHAYQNTKYDPVDYRGIPFKEVAVVIEGGDEQAIAEAIYLRLPTGQTGFGSSMVPFYDAQGIMNPIYFSRPTKVPVFIEMNLSIINSGTFPVNYEEQIDNAIISYAEYGGEGNADGFPPGVNIVLSRLYTPINSVPGHRINSLRIGTSWSNLSENDIVMNWLQVGEFSAANIRITV